MTTGQASAPTTPTVSAPWKRALRRLLARVSLLLVGCLVAGLFAEGLVWVFLGEQVRFPRHVVEAPWGLRYNDPGSRYRHRSADGTWEFRINGQGMRADRDFAYEKPAGTRRIVLLGDSFTMGYEVDVEQTFGSVLEEELKREGVALEVLNAGVSGFSNAEECLYLERELLKYDPDVVVLSFYCNDLEDNVNAGLFRLKDGQLELVRERYVPAGGLGNFLNQNAFFNWLSERSNAFAFVKERLTLLTKRRMLKERTREAAAAPSPPTSLDGPGAEQKELCVAILDRLHEELRERGVLFVVQDIPLYKDKPEPALEDWFPEDLFNQDRPGLVFLRMRDLLAGEVGSDRLYRKRSHVHWGPRGHEISGRALSRAILDATGWATATAAPAPSALEGAP